MNKYQLNKFKEITIPCHGHEKKTVGMVQKCEKKVMKQKRQGSCRNEEGKRSKGIPESLDNQGGMGNGQGSMERSLQDPLAHTSWNGSGTRREEMKQKTSGQLLQ